MTCFLHMVLCRDVLQKTGEMEVCRNELCQWMRRVIMASGQGEDEKKEATPQTTSSIRSRRQESSRHRSSTRTERQSAKNPLIQEQSRLESSTQNGAAWLVGGGATGGAGRSTIDLGCPGELTPLIRSSTWRAYGKAWEEWYHLAADKPVGSSDKSRMQVTMAFLARMHAKGVSGAVARNCVSALAFHFKLRGWSDLTKHFLVIQLLKGWRRKDKHSDNRRPISFQLLARLIRVARFICDSDCETALISAAFGLAFFGAMWVSEILAPALTKPGNLRRDGILICDNGLRVRIRRSKTDQEGRGTWFLLFAIKGDICTLVLMKKYMMVRSNGDQFFIHKNGFPLLSGQFLALLRRTLLFLGLPAAEFGTHSFRIGAATEASLAGLFESDIQRVGRWKSGCFTRWTVSQCMARWPFLHLLGGSASRSVSRRMIIGFYRCRRDLAWHERSYVVSEVVRIAPVSSSPTVVVIHARGNDLASSPLAELLTLMRSDMDKFLSFFSAMRLVWSEVIPRLVWRGAREQHTMLQLRNGQYYTIAGERNSCTIKQ
ncbi:unnamed protein product [Ranitomeya imitator]|uniref:Tyr recombinase domain-containing protein n=1 Tax=Ranitomeya imitator TaxID=111125 RepID=A0ABN9MHQ9_9NEOB|nr:unnamed protein product [Ranitomeya imitator]